MLFYSIYIFFIIFISINILQTIYQNKMNNNTLFLILVNYILNIVTIIFFFYFYQLPFSLVCSFFLMVFAFLLIRDFKVLFNRYLLYSLPYFTLTIYSFSFILALLLQSI